VLGFLRGAPERDEVLTSPGYLLGIALLAAIIGHFVEIQFGIAVAATRTSRTYFWTLVALLVVSHSMHLHHTATATDATPSLLPSASTHQGGRSHRRQRRPLRQTTTHPAVVPVRSGYSGRLITSSLLVGLVLMTMVYGFLSFHIHPANLPSVVWLFVFTWILGGIITLTDLWAPAPSRPSSAHLLSDCGIYTGITVGSTLLFMAVHLGPLRPVTDAANIPLPYYAALLLMLLATGGALLVADRLAVRLSPHTGGLVTAGLALAMLCLLSSVQLRVIRADVYYKQAVFSAQRHDQYDQAVALLQRAVALQPQQDFYYLFLGKTLLEQAGRVPQVQERQRLFVAAETALTRARDLQSLNPDHTANLARLHRLWAQYSDEPRQRTAHLQTAADFYAQATARSPHNVLLWNEWGMTYVALGDEAQARAKYQQSLALDAAYAPTYLHIGDLARAQGQWLEAAQAYEQALALDRNALAGHSALGLVYAQMGRLAEAVQANLRVIELAPNDLAAHRNLAILFQAMGQMPQALVHAQRALEVAPPEERAALEKLIAQWRQ
jgi:tetratricopeptide (TPR) repeat protein